MKKLLISLLLMIFLVSCGKDDVSPQKDSISGRKDAQKTEATLTATPVITALPRKAKKTVKEAFGLAWEEELILEKRRLYFSSEYDKVRHDDLSEWKDKNGNYHYPEGYEMSIQPSDEKMAAQQMPQKLLEEISTKELYDLIMSLPEFSQTWVRDNYIYYLLDLYVEYNFIENLMQRDDCATVVHEHYKKYSAKEKKKYSKCEYVDAEPLEDSEKWEAGKFRLTEALDWFCRYREGEKVPNEDVFGLGLLDNN